MRVGITVIALFFSISASALVDMRNANYSDSWVDIAIDGPGFPLKVERGYNSRSLYNGIFGFGWCSDLETSLEVTPENNVKITECGDGSELIYRARNFDSKDMNVAINNIIEASKKENPNLTAAQVKKLSNDLQLDRAFREEQAAKYKIKGQSADGVRYYANGRENEYLYKDKGAYVRVMTDGSLQRFDAEGKLSAIHDKNNNFLKYSWRNGLLTDITDNNGRKFVFEYYPNKKVKAVTGPNRLSATYKYKNLSDLEEVKLANGDTYTYNYDQLHNLTKITYPDKTTKILDYDTNKDWIKSLTDRQGCTEKYDWVLNSKDPKNNYVASLTKTCKGKVVSKNSFEFWFKPRPDSDGKYLHRLLSKNNQLSTDTTFHPKFAKPIKIVKNGITTDYDYYDTGLVKTQTVGKLKTEFFYYDDSKKIKEVRIGDRSTTFKYDTAGNLTHAKSTDGLEVTLQYDKKGRITSLADQAKRRVNISYEERFGKPKAFELPGVGSIKVSYNNNGEIDDRDFKNSNLTVPTQVANTFYSLLEVITPAGIDLGI